MVVVVEMTGVVARAVRAGKRLETAARPRRDKGVIPVERDLRVSGVVRGVNPVRAFFLHPFAMLWLDSRNFHRFFVCRGRFFRLTGDPRHPTVSPLIKTG